MSIRLLVLLHLNLKVRVRATLPPPHFRESDNASSGESHTSAYLHHHYSSTRRDLLRTHKHTSAQVCARSSVARFRCHDATCCSERVPADLRIVAAELVHDARNLLDGQRLLNAPREVIVCLLLGKEARDTRNNHALDTRTKNMHASSRTHIHARHTGPPIYQSVSREKTCMYTRTERGRWARARKSTTPYGRRRTSHRYRSHRMNAKGGGKASRMSSVPPGRNTRIISVMPHSTSGKLRSVYTVVTRS